MYNLHGLKLKNQNLKSQILELKIGLILRTVKHIHAYLFGTSPGQVSQSYAML